MAYKGMLPSDLWDKYDCEGGQEKLTLDLLVALEIQEKIEKATKEAKSKNGNEMVARRKQRQAQRQLLNDNDGLDMLKSMGVAFSKE